MVSKPQLPQTIVIPVVEPPQTNHNILHKLKQMGTKVVAGVKQAAIVISTKVAAGVKQVAIVIGTKFAAEVQGIVAPLRRAWGAFEEEQPANIPPPRNDFIINALLAFAAIKAQGGDQGFPFHTHAKSVMVSLISLLLYWFASAAERFMVTVRHHNPTHRAIARLGRILSVYLLVGSLASVFFSK